MKREQKKLHDRITKLLQNQEAWKTIALANPAPSCDKCGDLATCSFSGTAQVAPKFGSYRVDFTKDYCDECGSDHDGNRHGCVDFDHAWAVRALREAGYKRLGVNR